MLYESRYPVKYSSNQLGQSPLYKVFLLQIKMLFMFANSQESDNDLIKSQLSTMMIE